jgi:hypothetical protein
VKPSDLRPPARPARRRPGSASRWPRHPPHRTHSHCPPRRHAPPPGQDAPAQANSPPRQLTPATAHPSLWRQRAGHCRRTAPGVVRPAALPRRGSGLGEPHRRLRRRCSARDHPRVTEDPGPPGYGHPCGRGQPHRAGEYRRAGRGARRQHGRRRLNVPVPCRRKPCRLFPPRQLATLVAHLAARARERQDAERGRSGPRRDTAWKDCRPDRGQDCRRRG